MKLPYINLCYRCCYVGAILSNNYRYREVLLSQENVLVCTATSSKHKQRNSLLILENNQMYNFSAVSFKNRHTQWQHYACPNSLFRENNHIHGNTSTCIVVEKCKLQMVMRHTFVILSFAHCCFKVEKHVAFITINEMASD